MDAIPPSQVPKKDVTLWYYHLRRQDTVWGRFLGWIDFRRGVALGILVILGIWLLRFIVSVIPHPYAGIGLVAFLILGTFACFVLPRRRVLVVVGLGVLIAGVVVVLHIRATQHVIIRNDSGVEVEFVEVSLWHDIECHRGSVVGARNLPVGYNGEVSVLIPGYRGRLEVRGKLNDGTILSSGGFSSLEISEVIQPGESSDPYRGKTEIIIEKGGKLKVMYP